MPDSNVSPKPSILVVDDEDCVREILSWLLEEAGHQVFEAAGASQALQFLRTHGPVDIVLSDINMPGMDGMELALLIRRDWPEVPVLLISGRPPPNGARPFIPKPFRWETLASAIQSVADAAPGRRWAGA